MSSSSQVLIALAVVLAGSSLLGIASYKNIFGVKSLIISYFWGGRSLKTSDTAHLMLSSSFSLNGTLYQVWLGYQIGIASLWIQAIWCLSYILLSRKAERISNLSNDGTLHGVIGQRFGDNAAKAASWASITGFTIQVGWELAIFLSLFTLLSGSKGISFALATFLTLTVAIMVGFYTMFGGIRGNLRANRAQNFIGVIAFIIAVGFAVMIGNTPLTGGGASAFANWQSHSLLMTSLGIGGLVTNLIFSLSWQFVDMSCWQNLAASQPDGKTSKKALLLSSFWVFLFPGVFGTLAGMFLRGTKDLTSDNILAHLLQGISDYPIIGIFVIAGFLAAMLSTIDGLLLSLGQTFVWDVSKQGAVHRVLQYWKTNSNKEFSTNDIEAEAIEKTERDILFSTRTAVLVAAVVGALLVLCLRAFQGLSLFDLIYVVIISQMILLPTTLSILFEWKVLGKCLPSICLGWLAGVGALSYGLAIKNPDIQAWSPVIGLLFAFLFLLPVPKKLSRHAVQENYGQGGIAT